jgi:hypothetical protein
MMSNGTTTCQASQGRQYVQIVTSKCRASEGGVRSICSPLASLVGTTDSGCQNNGVNSTRWECVNATHGRSVAWTGTACTGTLTFNGWLPLGCQGTQFYTCTTVSGAAATGAAAAAVAVAMAAALLASARKHE